MLRLNHIILILVLMLGLCLTGCGAEPLIKTKFGLFLQGTNNLGLPSADTVNTVVYYAPPEGCHYSHHPAIISFHDQLYVMWSSGLVDEDSPSQQIDYAVSADGIHWSPSKIFVPAPDGPAGPKRRTAGGWWVANNTLYACFATHYGLNGNPEKSPQKWIGNVTLEYTSSPDGITWAPARHMIDNFMPNEAPRWNGKYWLITGENTFGMPKVLYTDDPSGTQYWRPSLLPPVWSGIEPNESSWYRRADGTLIMLFRDDNLSKRLFVAKSADDGVSWSRPQPATFPDATSKIRAGNLPDGEAFIINDPSSNPNRIRIPLAISISRDGRLFDRCYAIRSEPTNFRYPGHYKSPGYSYPGSTIWGASLYVTYSINKEDIAVSQILLSKLEAP